MSKIDAAGFVLRCRNWYEVALPIATHKIPPRVILRNGARFESDSVYWADMHAIFFQGIYTPRYLPIEKNDVVVDIGANIGVFTIYAARRTKKTVYAIEPSPDNFRAIKQNIAANGLKNVVPLNYAVSDKNGIELLFNNAASQHHRLNKVMHDSTATCINVPSITLIGLMESQKIDRIDFLKLDCEGAEEIILQTTSLDCLQKIRKIAMEFHDHLTLLNHDGMLKLLEDAGFTVRIDWDGKSVLGLIYAWR
ncbi:MAG: FkbM family methyltransferase [Ktedonobacteraceae bacterium]